MISILISSAGRRVELLNCFRAAARVLSIDLQIVAIDMTPEWSPACQVADIAVPVPKCTAENYLEVVSGICEQHQVDMIIPTIDTELMLYAENSHAFAAKGTQVLVSHPDFVAVARDKGKTAHQLKTHGIATPETWSVDSCLNSDRIFPYPLMLKPTDGSCSAGIAVVESKESLEKMHVTPDSNILQELCQGKEYTINAFYDRNGQCMACVPHYRKMVRAGEVCFAETIKIPEFTTIAEKLGDIFSGIWGTICFQGFQNDAGVVQIFEINARFGGGYPICDRAGGTFAKWILQDLNGQKPDYHNDWQEGVRMMRYDAAVFTQAG